MKSGDYSICVYCGSRDGADPAFSAAAEELGQLIAEHGCRLVYGAGDVGLMGRVARAATTAGGATFGVIPQHLVAREVAKHDLNTLVVTETMHERKKIMVMNSDAIAVLPGGAGTLDEFFEMLTWRQLGLHAKPIVLVNIGGFWDPLVTLIDHIETTRFADGTLTQSVQVVDNVTAAMPALLNNWSA
ncbi:MAG: TIGR00730 family Rossman fold protein [Rhodobacteraceae bacterium]|nr:TIGR00730 family Rossman fold protein [Paracoccaceae bacterium]